MDRKKIYIVAIFIILLSASFLLYLKVTEKEIEIEPTPLSKTVIPTDYSQEEKINLNEENQINNNSSKVFLELNNSEVFLDLVSVDLNQDGAEDQIIAVKKLLDPFLHLIFAIQNPINNDWQRVYEIKTTITEPKSLNFYTMHLSNSLPLVIYSGMTSDNQQVFSMQKIIKKETLKFEEVISLNADIKIQIQELQGEEENELINFASFKIYTYDSDPNAPNTLNQIKTEYSWDYNTNKYEKGITSVIPGEKIENKLLKELKTGNKESIIEFLSGLWFKKIIKNSDRGRSFYFDKKQNTIIFNRPNIEEIYKISSVGSLRYGLYIKTQNKAIPNIIRVVRIEVKGVDEIQVKVRENVRRIKYGTKSLWTGIYKKSSTQTNNIEHVETEIEKLKTLIKKSNNAWTNAENAELIFENNSYKLKVYQKKEKGIFNLMEIKNKIILQLRNQEKQNTFYLINFKEEDKIQTLILKEIKLNLNEMIEVDEEEIVLSREI